MTSSIDLTLIVGLTKFRRRYYPINSLEAYLQATRDSTCSYLFLNPNTLSTRLNANHASTMIVDLVRAGDPGAQFHVRDIRSFSSSLA